MRHDCFGSSLIIPPVSLAASSSRRRSLPASLHKPLLCRSCKEVRNKRKRSAVKYDHSTLSLWHLSCCSRLCVLVTAVTLLCLRQKKLWWFLFAKALLFIKALLFAKASLFTAALLFTGAFLFAKALLFTEALLFAKAFPFTKVARC